MVRPFSLHDAAGVLAIYKPFIEDSGATFETVVPSLESFVERMRLISERYPFFVWEEGGKILGYAFATSHRERIAYQWVVETSVYVSEPGRGIGKVLYESLLAELSARGFVWAYGIITLPNHASLALHTHCGFEHFATYVHAGQKNGLWHDVVWVRKLLNPATPQLPEPLFLSAQENA